MTDQADFNQMDLRDPIGLCAACRHARVIHSSRGSTFYLCQLAETDPRFDKYPRLPVLRCIGYEPAEEAEDEASHHKPGTLSSRHAQRPTDSPVENRTWAKMGTIS